MSLDATSWVMKQFIPDPASKLVLLALSDMTGDEHGNILWDEARALDVLVADTSMRVEHVRWCLHALVANGLLSAPYKGSTIKGGPDPQWYVRINLGKAVDA